MRALHETPFASILSASAVFGASAALAAAIPLAMQNGPGSMTDTRQAWPETKGQFAGTGERITALGGSGGNVSITVSMISITWTRYDALAETAQIAKASVPDIYGDGDRSMIPDRAFFTGPSFLMILVNFLIQAFIVAMLFHRRAMARYRHRGFS